MVAMKRSSSDIGSSSDDFKKQKTDDNKVSAEEGLHSLDMNTITKIMNAEGEVLPSVLLKAEGTTTEVSFDTTPKLKKVNEAVGCLPHENITFCGMWEDVVEDGDCVVLIIRDSDTSNGSSSSSSTSMNAHKLQPPFHESQIPGDILLQRSNSGGEVIPFTLDMYKAFQAKTIAEWTPQAEDPAAPASTENDEDEEEEEEEEEDDEAEEERMRKIEEVEVDPEECKSRLVEFLQDYATKNDGQMPSAEELVTIQHTILYMLKSEKLDEDYEEGEDDEEDEDEDDEEGKEGSDEEEDEEAEEEEGGKEAPVEDVFGFGKSVKK